MITAPFPSTAFRTRVPTRSVPRSSRGAAWLTPAGSPAPPRSCPRIVPAHSRDDHTIRRNLMCVPARRKPKTKKARLAVWHLGTPRALQPFVSFDSSSSTFSGNCRKYQQKRMSYDQTVCEIDSAATRNAPSESTVQGGHIWRGLGLSADKPIKIRARFSADPPSIKEVGETRLKLFNKVGRRYTIQPGLRNFTSSCVRTSLEPADARSRGALLRQLLGEGLLGAGGGARFPLRVVLLLLGLGLPGVRLGSARAGTGYERVSDVRDRARNASTMIRFW